MWQSLILWEKSSLSAILEKRSKMTDCFSISWKALLLDFFENIFLYYS